MIICGVKLTHDSAVALIDDNRLVFSVETEKLANGLRHARMDDLGVIEDVLADFGYDLPAVDRLVIDGWRKTEKTRLWNAQEVAVRLAPYRRGIGGEGLFQSYDHELLDLPYSSYSHYAGHVAAAYCSSPFAARGEDAYVLCWDGRMFPFLYHIGPDGSARSLGPLHCLLGDAYHSLAQLHPPFYPPFTNPVEAQQALALPGKIMAFAGLGRPDETAMKALDRAYDDAVRVRLSGRAVRDADANERTGRSILDHLMANWVTPGVAPVDAIASVQAYLGELLVGRLVDAVSADGRRTPNLCLTGGCALNIKWNRAIRDCGIADEVWVPPFPNDAGSAIGAACCALLTETDEPALDWDVYAGPPLGTADEHPDWRTRACSIDELAVVLHTTGEPVVFLDGRAELGPRALGHRSILAPAVSPGTKDLLNVAKDREGYRPVAPICLEELAGEVFAPGTPDPFMLFDHDVRPAWRQLVPAICHVDGTARVQTVAPGPEPVSRLLAAYHRESGIPLLCNTSANHKGRGFFPDVRSAMDWGQVSRIWARDTLYEHV